MPLGGGEIYTGAGAAGTAPDATADLHLRKLRYFLAVARNLSFAGAARELLVAQPALSRAVKALEEDLGVRLFERDTQHVRLTNAGRVFVDDAAALLSLATAARRRTQAAAREQRLLTVGFQPGVAISEIVSACSQLHPEVGVQTRRLDCHPDPTKALDGVVDAAVVRAVDSPIGPTVVRLFEDPTLVALPATHPLAGAEVVTIAQLEAETMLAHGADRAGPVVRNMEEGLEAVLLGKGLAWTPASAAAYYQRSGIVYRPVRDAPAVEVVLVVEPGRIHRDEVQWFISAARDYFRGRSAPGRRDSIAA